MSGNAPDNAVAADVLLSQNLGMSDSQSNATTSFRVVAIGASAGGLDACQGFLDSLPPKPDMAFLFVQHLEPSHESLLSGLLQRHTALTVSDASDGVVIEINHLYVITPGTYLAVENGRLRVSERNVRHGARFPFDYLLRSVAEGYGSAATCVVLSGTGSDGSAGLRMITECRGLVIAQDPKDAAFDGMPKSAIATGLVDLVLPIDRIGGALFPKSNKGAQSDGLTMPSNDGLMAILDFLRVSTQHDFTHYKLGTLQRRIERRIGMDRTNINGMAGYLRRLKEDEVERDLLAKDLLIHVTRFFRDAEAFDYLAKSVIPDLVKAAAPERQLRIWVAGCSSGEEAYSLAILFSEAIKAHGSQSKLQVFASDIEGDAIAVAREGFYPEAIKSDLSAERLSRYFTVADNGYRVSTELRGSVVFTVQNVLSDPPFSRLDFLACRNLLIYLAPDAQKKAISLFHLALNERGILFLGAAETTGSAEGRFLQLGNAHRIYRNVGRSRPGVFAFPGHNPKNGPSGAKPAPSASRNRPSGLGELSRQMVLELHGPAAVVINRKNECLYALGPIDRYLIMAQGLPTVDLLTLARKEIRTKLRAAVQQAVQTDDHVVLKGWLTDQNNRRMDFDLDVQPFKNDGEDLLLICFLDQRSPPTNAIDTVPQNAPRIAELERELEETRIEFQDAIRNLEMFGEEQKSINDETLSVNEEYQSTNEELLTSKEELQSLNEELTALNGQLQETLEHQRTTFNDLQNVLNSTDVATVFLDVQLNIRFFTPATKHLFNIIPGDIGRPLADLSSLATDTALLADARFVLKSLTPVEIEIETSDRKWFMRRVLPYRAQDGSVEGVVITFADVTNRRHTADALVAAKREAERATLAKSRFLAAASHDLRQPLQTLTLVQGLLARSAEGEKQQRLVKRFDETLGAMTGMLNALLDINQIEAGVVTGEVTDFSLGDLLSRLAHEFRYLAQARGLALHFVETTAWVRSDPRLIEQMVRNLIANALKYTITGKILIGCRHHANDVSIQVWDSGVGIVGAELQSIFDEYHQIDNASRETSKGLGLGLSIVKRLGDLLGHQLSVISTPAKGSMFAIRVPLTASSSEQLYQPRDRRDETSLIKNGESVGVVLVVEDDPEVRDMLADLLKSTGHYIMTASDPAGAMELSLHGALKPDLILADFNLPGVTNGIEIAKALRDELKKEVPVIILTGDISTNTLKLISQSGFAQLHKPVRLVELTALIQSLLSKDKHLQKTQHSSEFLDDESLRSTLHVVDDDPQTRSKIRRVFEDDGFVVQTYESSEAFLESRTRSTPECLLVDANLPGMNGLELLSKLNQRGDRLPSIMMTGESDVSIAVDAMKAGVLDFIEKPIALSDLHASVRRAFELAKDSSKLVASQTSAATLVSGLTERQHEIMGLVLAGHPSKNIAVDLGISQRTVENHRAAIMSKTRSKSLPALARLADMAAKGSPPAKIL